MRGSGDSEPAADAATPTDPATDPTQGADVMRRLIMLVDGFVDAFCVAFTVVVLVTYPFIWLGTFR